MRPLFSSSEPTQEINAADPGPKSNVPKVNSRDLGSIVVVEPRAFVLSSSRPIHHDVQCHVCSIPATRAGPDLRPMPIHGSNISHVRSEPSPEPEVDHLRVHCFPSLFNDHA